MKKPTGTERNLSLKRMMRSDWDARISLDYRAWMNDRIDTDEQLWVTGRRDFCSLMKGVNTSEMQNQIALDLGCGVGRLMLPASSVFKQIIGIDISAKAIHKAKGLLGDRKNISFLVGNGLDLDLVESDSIDFAYSFGVLPHIPTVVFAEYLIELARVLKPNSCARLQVFIGKAEDSVKEDTAAFRSYGREQFQNAANYVGFTVESMSELDLGVELPNDGLLRPEIIALRKVNSLCKTAPFKIAQCKIAGEVEQILLPGGEASAGSAWSGSRMEQILALTFAHEKINKGDIGAANKFLNFASTRHKTPDAETIEVYKALRAKLASV